MLKLRYLVFFLLLLLFLPFFVSANSGEELFKAEVLEILEENIFKRLDGSESINQKLKLAPLDGAWQGEEIIFDGTEHDVISSVVYQPGDKVLVSAVPDAESDYKFFVVGFARENTLYWLAFLFALVVILVGRLKGLRALFVLLITFLIILKFIIPQILAGQNPVLISIFGSLCILVLAVYLTEGFKPSSSIAILSIFISLVITGFLSVCYTSFAKLTGFASEEIIYIIELTGASLNLQGLLLAGIIIGTLGVLDDVVISQVVLVRELKATNNQLSPRQLYRQAMRVGISHLSSMTNTLFLAYAGASLPLLILFNVKNPPFLSFSQVINNEIIATEIVRTLVGTTGLILSVPIATFLAVYLLKSGHK